MYTLYIKYHDNKESNGNFSEPQLRVLLKKGSKKLVKWATVTTPSGTTRDVTKHMNK